MLVVMLVLLVATATATISVQATQQELRSAGFQREALQARYVSETALMSTLSWVDALGDEFLNTWKYWETNPPPIMAYYGEPEIDPGRRHHASRAFQGQLEDLQQGVEVPPIKIPDGNDPASSLGGRSALIARPYVVDITDCQQSTAGHTPGAPIGGGPGSGVKVTSFYCTMTARARLCTEKLGSPGECMANPEDGGDLLGVERDWQLTDAAGVTRNYEQDRFQVAHDSRATFITPEMIVPVE
jgi:hypothetical protein